MAYTPVPAIAAGDTIDEVFLNTYWVDNMAASVPDVFSAKGQLPVGLGVDDMGVLDVGTDGQVLHSDSTQTLGLIWKNINNIYRRQGGSATVWNSQGSTNYTPANSMFQVGTGRMGFVATAISNKQITFPVAFGNTPIVFIVPQGIPLSNGLERFYVASESATVFTAFAQLISSATANLDFNWLAIGPT